MSLEFQLDNTKANRTLRLAKTVSIETAKYDFAAKLREQRRLLELIQPPDDVFIAAARNACIQAGLSQETIDILHPPGSASGSKLSR